MYLGGKCMKKLICLTVLGFMFTGVQAFAHEHHFYGRSHMHRPPMPPRHYVRVVRPVYTTHYYYSTPVYYNTYYAEPAYGATQTVVIRESGINTAANVINAAANVATAIRLLSW